MPKKNKEKQGMPSGYPVQPQGAYPTQQSSSSQYGMAAPPPYAPTQQPATGYYPAGAPLPGNQQIYGLPGSGAPPQQPIYPSAAPPAYAPVGAPVYNAPPPPPPPGAGPLPGSGTSRTTVVVNNGFDSGARFDGRSSASLPPPPPGVMPNAAQMAASQGHNVVVRQQKGGFLEGSGSGAGYTFW